MAASHADLDRDAVSHRDRRSGIPRSTLQWIEGGGGCNTKTLGKLMNASGGLITYNDLQPAPKDEEGEE